MIKADFHVHTSASDGVLSPREVINRAIKNNVKFISITDHDTISGLDEAINQAYGESITVIPGIELSTQYNGESVHILGLFKGNDYKNEDLIYEINKIKNNRILRAKEMISKLKQHFNIEINFKQILAKSKDTIARPHIARSIIESNYPYTMDEIFDKFIGKDCAAYVPTLKLSTPDGVKLLKKYGAIVFLAHPKLIKNSNIEDFLHMGFDGIEAIYYQNTLDENSKYIKIVDDNNLLTTCGSDFHGNLETDKRHGDIGSVKISYNYLNKLLQALDIEL